MKTVPKVLTGGRATVGQFLDDTARSGLADAARQGVSYALTAAFRLLTVNVSDG